MIKLSLVIPTYNRAEYLEISLESFASQSLDRHLYEIILVDNNSTDNTRNIFNKFCRRYPRHNWVYFFEPKQGLHYARNRGILLSKGNIIAFGDDDIEASPRWLESILDSFAKNDRIGIVGGPIYPIWDGEPPDWIYDYGTRDIHGVFAYLNYGNESRYLEKEDLYGCNFSIRKERAIEINGSGPDTFPPHMIHYSGRGEGAMLERLRERGYQTYYNADASVRHHAPVARCTLNYFINRYQRWAVEDINHRYNTRSSLFMISAAVGVQTVGLITVLLPYAAIAHKINKIYFLIIRVKYTLFQWKHLTKLILNSKLRRCIRKTDYLAELER